MKRHPEVVLLLLQLFAITLLAAQQATGAQKVADVKKPTLPASNSTTAYDPFFSEGRGYWERDNLVYVDPRSPRVDLYDKDKNVASVKVTIPGYRTFLLATARSRRMVIWLSPAVRTRMRAGKSIASLGSRAGMDMYCH